MSSNNEWGKTSQEQAYEPFGTAPSDPLWTPPPVGEQPEPESRFRQGPPFKATLKWILYIWLIAICVLAIISFVTGAVGALDAEMGG